MDLDIAARDLETGMLVVFGFADVEVAEVCHEPNHTVVVTFTDGDRRRYESDEIVPVYVP